MKFFAASELQNFVGRPPKPQHRSQDMIIRKYIGFEDMKADEYRYWQKRPRLAGAKARSSS